MGFLSVLRRRSAWRKMTENAISKLHSRLAALSNMTARLAALAESADAASKENQAAIRSLTKELSRIATKVSEMKAPRHTAPPPAPSLPPPQTALDSLTPTEKRLLHVLAALIRERPAKEAAHGEIARELYPAAPPARVRSTVSDYLRRLEAKGLVRREHRGNRAYVAFTDGGLKTIEQAGALEIRKALSTS